jgi:hypothetical protein
MTSNRAENALADVVAVERMAPGLCRVVTWSDAYPVDVRGEGCNCPDNQYHLTPDERCKHEVGAMLAMRDDVETPGLAVENLDARAVADGGERPDECACMDDTNLPCSPCYVSGFETINPEVQE